MRVQHPFQLSALRLSLPGASSPVLPGSQIRFSPCLACAWLVVSDSTSLGLSFHICAVRLLAPIWQQARTH